MDITKVKLSDITPAQYNPRKISNQQFEKLGQSIEEFGLVDPIVINLKNNTIIGGHQRFDYLYHNQKDSNVNLLKLGDIGWVFTDTDLKIKDEAHEKALNLALNRISGEFEINQLNAILDELAEFEMTDLTGFDYSLDEFEYEFVPIEDDDEEFEDEELLEEEYDEEEEIQIQEEKPIQKTNEIEKDNLQKGIILKNHNNIIFYGEETDENITELLSHQDTIMEYNIKNLKLIESINIPLNFYITNSKSTIKQLLKDTHTKRLR